MRTRAYMFFASRDLPEFDLAMFGVIRRWCLIGKFAAQFAYALNANGGLTMEIQPDGR